MNFNTSHVVVYQELMDKLEMRSEFQYISCCSLSIPAKITAPKHVNFNTSHVVVYRLSQIQQVEE